MTTANQTLDRLRIQLRGAFRHWIPVRRNTKDELEHLARNLRLRISPRFLTGATVGAVVGGILAAPFTFGTSLAVTATGVGIGAAVGAGSWNLTAEEKQTFRLAEVQGAINSDRRACEELQETLKSLKRTFSSTTSASATTAAMVRNVDDAFTRASRFANSSVLPGDITQLVNLSLDNNRGSTSAIVGEIRSILDDLKCPDETEIQRLVKESFIE